MMLTASYLVRLTSPGVIEDPGLLVDNTLALTAHIGVDTKSLHKNCQIIL